MKSMKNNIAKAASIMMLAMSVTVIGPERGMAKDGKQAAARTSSRRTYNQSETLSSNMQRSSGRGQSFNQSETLSSNVQRSSGPPRLSGFIVPAENANVGDMSRHPDSAEMHSNVISSLGQKYTMIRRSRR